mgnify:CR=1 FL=1
MHGRRISHGIQKQTLAIRRPVGERTIRGGRFFRFDEQNAIKAAFVFVRMDEELSRMPAETLALSQMVQTILLWSDQAFAGRSALARTPEGHAVLRPDIAAVIRAAYDPVMPASADDPSHALRLAARTGQMQ